MEKDLHKVVVITDAKFFATYATKQSYIQFTDSKQKTKKLLVAVTANMAGKHHDVVEVMFQHFQKYPCTDKAKALSLRAALLD